MPGSSACTEKALFLSFKKAGFANFLSMLRRPEFGSLVLAELDAPLLAGLQSPGLLAAQLHFQTLYRQPEVPAHL
ncbi:hypothetical protein [Agrobacterium tumefaciens]|uniref:hypothetical protein n=1 Tax=Agrobacterium tumefaciens TaxID=358 RepID=UPI00157384E7|nr:hypothetical protein [Agrobacterium tumefaciens]